MSSFNLGGGDGVLHNADLEFMRHLLAHMRRSLKWALPQALNLFNPTSSVVVVRRLYGISFQTALIAIKLN